MSHDTLIHRLVRPVVRQVAGTGVTPNQLTTLRLATGVLSAIGFAQGGVLWPDLGAAVMLLSLLLDRADGELARQTGKMSRSGYRYDLICDCTATVADLLGMGWGSREMLGPVSGLLGIVGGVGVATVFWLLHVVQPAAPKQRSRILVDPDDAMMLTPFLIWLGLMPWAVVTAAAATPVLALVLGALIALKAAGRSRARQ